MSRHKRFALLAAVFAMLLMGLLMLGLFTACVLYSNPDMARAGLRS